MYVLEISAESKLAVCLSRLLTRLVFQKASLGILGSGRVGRCYASAARILDGQPFILTSRGSNQSRTGLKEDSYGGEISAHVPELCYIPRSHAVHGYLKPLVSLLSCRRLSSFFSIFCLHLPSHPLSKQAWQFLSLFE